MTIDTGASMTIAWLDIVAGQPEADQNLCLTDCLWRDHPGAEGGLCRADSGTSGPKDLGVRRGGYGPVHPAVRCLAGLRRVRGPRTTFVATGPGGGDAVETRRPTKICHALNGRRRIDSGSM